MVTPPPAPASGQLFGAIIASSSTSRAPSVFRTHLFGPILEAAAFAHVADAGLACTLQKAPEQFTARLARHALRRQLHVPNRQARHLHPKPLRLLPGQLLGYIEQLRPAPP